MTIEIYWSDLTKECQDRLIANGFDPDDVDEEMPITNVWICSEPDK